MLMIHIGLQKNKKDGITCNMGGNPEFIDDLDEIDDCIEKVKYLKSKNALHRQEEFRHQELYWVKDDIEREIVLLLNAPGNELTSVVSQGSYLFVPYNDVNDPADMIRIDTAKSYNEYTVQFLEYRTVSLKFNKKGYYVYSYDEQNQLYYKTTVGKNQKIEASSMPIPAVQGWSMLTINGLELLC